jgi:hypothetical protein
VDVADFRESARHHLRRAVQLHRARALRSML